MCQIRDILENLLHKPIIDSLAKTTARLEKAKKAPSSTPSYAAVLAGHAQTIAVPERVLDNNTNDNLRSKDKNKLLQALKDKTGRKDIIDAATLPSGDIRIHVSTEEGLNQLQKEEPWQQAKVGVRPITPLLMVEIADVPVWTYNAATTSQEEFLKEIQKENANHLPGIEFKRIRWLIKSYKKEKTSSSLILSVGNSREVDRIIENGLLAGNGWRKAGAWDHQCEINQCFKCCAIRHISRHCPNSQRCRKCAEAHDTKDKKLHEHH